VSRWAAVFYLDLGEEVLVLEAGNWRPHFLVLARTWNRADKFRMWSVYRVTAGNLE